jgi:hypothetical protein
MDAIGSLPHSQAPANCPYPKINPVRASPSYVLKIHFNIIFPSTPGSLKVVSFPQVSPPKCCMHLSSLSYVPHAPSISFLMILSPE